MNPNQNLFERNAAPVFSLSALQYFLVTRICRHLKSISLKTHPSHKFIAVSLENSKRHLLSYKLAMMPYVMNLILTRIMTIKTIFLNLS